MALGALLAISPWLLGYTGLGGAMVNALIIGLMVFALSALALTLIDGWEAYFCGLLGIWTVLSPWLIGFTRYDNAMMSHLVIGGAIVLIAAYEIWQSGRAPS